MNTILKRFSVMEILLALVLAAIMTMTAVPARADTQNYAPSVPGVVVLPFHFTGTYSATTDPVAQFKMPFACDLVGVSANAGSSDAAGDSLSVDVEDDGTSVLSATIDIAGDETGSVAEGTVSSSSIADESVMTLVFTISGSTPAWGDVTVLLTCVRT